MAISPEDKQKIMNLWNDGNSATIISKMTGFTRNTIIGFVSRNREIEVVGRIIKTKVEKNQISLPKMPKLKAPTTKLKALEPKVVKKFERYEALSTCQFFLDDDTKCDAPSNGSWCEYHRKVVYVDRSKVVKQNHKAYKIARLFRV